MKGPLKPNFLPNIMYFWIIFYDLGSFWSLKNLASVPDTETEFGLTLVQGNPISYHLALVQGIWKLISVHGKVRHFLKAIKYVVTFLCGNLVETVFWTYIYSQNVITSEINNRRNDANFDESTQTKFGVS